MSQPTGPTSPPDLPTPPAAPDEAPAHEPQTTHRLRRLEFRAALLLIFMGVLLVAAVLYLMWVRGAFEATEPLYLTTDDSEGVVVGMDMTFSGFPIGRVRRIELAEGGTVRLHVDVPLKSAHWLRTSSVFTLERGIVGAARLRAFTGVLDDPPLPAGSERMVLRGDVSAEIPRMVADMRDVLQNVNRLTSGESQLAATLQEVRAFTQKLNSHEGGLMAALTGNQADARQISELLTRTNLLLKNLDTVAVRVDGLVKKADTQVLGESGLVTDAQAAVRQMNALLQDVRQSVVKADAVLKEVQGVAGNANQATQNLGDLRADVESSLLRIDALITQINRTWPFAPKEKEVTLP
ncbi:MAG: MlaD family protein [Pseudomonadota bacterium]|nr:MlaD family protein [Pseudomonadota bacterium]